MKKITEWIQIILIACVIMYLGHFYTMKINDHIYVATHSSFAMPSNIYIKNFYKVTPETRINGQTPIQYTIQNSTPLTDKNIGRVTALVDFFESKGVDVNAASSFGLTALHYSIMDEDVKAVQLLIDKKADVNQPVHIDAKDQIVKATLIEGLSPLAFLEQRRADGLIKNEESVAQIETMLKDAGAKGIEKPKVVEKPKTPEKPKAPAKAKPAPKKAPVKAKNKKKHK